ncbi:MAG TPA: sigma-70 family RNA polymerase sigma factor [Anaeromyxobacter sp.]
MTVPGDDQELVEAARAGDRRALGKLLERHQGAVYRFGMKMCGESEDAKDVLQETLFAAARTLPDFRGASSVTTWLYTIARSFCLKKRRTSKFAPERIESLEAQAEASFEIPDARRTPEEDAAARQLRGVLDAAIAELDPMYREVLILRDVEGLAAAEVAEVLGISVEAVKSRLHRARIAVRERVAPILGHGAPELPQASPGCQDVVTIFSRRLEGEIDAGACAELEKHLQTCAACRGRCDSLRSTLTMCRNAGQAQVPPEVARSVREALRAFLTKPT